MKLLLAAVFAAVFYLIDPLLGWVFFDADTGFKQWVSATVVTLLAPFGYPISVSGVILSIGQYQMLVADACLGLARMLSLSVLGMLFMYIRGRKSLLHNAIMLASILPVGCAANVIRLILLVLITHHLGDEAAMGYVHGTAGIVLMLGAVLLLFALDSLLERVLRPRGPPPPMPSPANAGS